MMTEFTEYRLEHNATVIAATATSVLIETERRSACGHCSSGASCGTSVIAELFGQRVNRIQLDNNLYSKGVRLQAGDDVVIGMPEHLLLRAAILAYMLPIFSMLVFALLVQTAGFDDIYVFLASMTGLFCGLYLAGTMHSRNMADEIMLLQKKTPKSAMVNIATVNFNDSEV